MRIIKMIIAGVVFGVIALSIIYTMIMSNFSGHNDERCNPHHAISLVEWVLGIRPSKSDCRGPP